MSISLKKCTKCGGEFPATLEYFYGNKTGKHGLSAMCRPCMKQYQRGWRQENLEREKERDRKRHIANRDSILEYKRQWYAKNREVRSEYDRRRYEANREQITEDCRRWRLANPERANESVKRWRLANPHAKRIMNQRRKARKRQLPDNLTREQWLNCLAWWHNCCAYCGKAADENHTIEAEHFIPLASPDCTGTIAGNILPSCKVCNGSKNDSPPVEWINRKFKDRAAEIRAKIQEYFDSLR